MKWPQDQAEAYLYPWVPYKFYSKDLKIGCVGGVGLLMTFIPPI